MRRYHPPLLAPRPTSARLAIELALLEQGPLPSPALPARAGGARILVVDDDAELRAYVRACLEPAWAVSEAGDGLDALAQAAHAPFALVITDARMPLVSGSKLCRALRAHPTLSALPILAISGEVDALDGANAFLPKPFTRAQLIAAVQALVPARA